MRDYNNTGCCSDTLTRVYVYIFRILFCNVISTYIAVFARVCASECLRRTPLRRDLLSSTFFYELQNAYCTPPPPLPPRFFLHLIYHFPRTTLALPSQWYLTSGVTQSGPSSPLPPLWYMSPFFFARMIQHSLPSSTRVGLYPFCRLTL